MGGLTVKSTIELAYLIYLFDLQILMVYIINYSLAYWMIDIKLKSVIGDGRANFLCIGQDTTVNGWLNKGLNNFQFARLIKSNEGKEHVNLCFANINRDIEIANLKIKYKLIDNISRDAQMFLH